MCDLILYMTVRLGLMCGLYEPPGGRKQQSYCQLSNSICQDFRGITYTDSSVGEHKHCIQRYMNISLPICMLRTFFHKGKITLSRAMNGIHTCYNKIKQKEGTHRFFSSSKDRWSNPTDIVLRTFRFGPAGIHYTYKDMQGCLLHLGYLSKAKGRPAASNSSASIFSVSVQSRPSTPLTFWRSSFLGTGMSSESHSSNCTLGKQKSHDWRFKSNPVLKKTKKSQMHEHRFHIYIQIMVLLRDT